MIVHMCAQRSAEWFELRRDKFTASSFGKFVMRKDQKAKDAFQNAIDALIGEEADGDDCPPSYEDFWMKRGTLLEGAAREAYERHTGSVIEEVGLCCHDALPLAFSPDALVDNRSFGLELKCPSGKIQYKRLREQKCPDEYLCQIHGSMAIMGANHWDFFSWHPTLPAFYIRVHRDSFTSELEKGLRDLAGEFLRQKAWLESLKAA